MDSGLGSDEERRGRTKEQKQRHNQQLLTACFLDTNGSSGNNNATSLENGDVERRSQERRQGALLFQTSIPQYSTVHMPECSPPDTPYNSIVHLENDETSLESVDVLHKAPLGFYVDLSDVQDPEPPVPPTTSAKKNIFSMVIDFQAPKKDMPHRLRRSRIGSSTSSNNSDMKDSSSSGTKDNGSDSNGHENHVNGDTSDNNVDSACGIAIDEAIEVDDKPLKEETIDLTSNSTSTHFEEKQLSLTSETESKQFVRLSDLERQSPIVDLTVLPRMTRSIPESSWVEEPLLMSRSMGYRSAPRPLPPEPSEMTDSSGSDTGQCQRRLGTDLLKMFLEEIGPDVHVKVSGRTIKAHRCILVSRCQYFAGSLSGHQDDVIHLRGFSYEAVHFSMCHIYSGASHVPDSISLEELAALADLLGLEGLKEVVAHALKSRHCHNFHKPCPGCLTGVPEVLPLAAAHGLDELYQRCLQWLTQNYEKSWPTRSFASLPRELRDKCLQQHLVHMTAENVLATILSCDRLLANLPQLRWSEPIIQLGIQLADACQLYLRQHLSAVLSSTSFTALDSEMLHRLEEQFLSATDALGPEQACKSYGRCHKMLDQSWNREHMDLLRKLDKQLEQTLATRADKATRCSAWQKLEPALRARVREAARPSRLPRASSSDSSRTSSPATSRAPAGSPSLRRSLLLAARAPQIPPSPSTVRRNANSLTRPTQSSAAKSAPSRNIKPALVKSPTSKDTAPKVRPLKKEPISKREPMKAKPQNQVRTPTVIRRSVREDCKSPSKSPLNVSKSPSRSNVCKSPVKGGVSKSPSRNAVCKSPSKVTCKSPVKTVKSPVKVDNVPSQSTCRSPSKTSCRSPTKSVPIGMTRSGTFLKEEPTVLGRAH
ncbi:BTB/POZ domain [Popillia japonica]|uniref:BTB/POZ domain n=1 Tax=Popillia japonica TaxID=7064 RepID=A0AAW1M1J5_POPJA